MHQLILLVPNDVDLIKFDDGWPDFLKSAEQMPGLIRESVIRFDQVLYGTQEFQRIYLFSFADRQSLENALLSPSGEKSGDILHKISAGKIIILTGIMQSDSITHIKDHSSNRQE